MAYQFDFIPVLNNADLLLQGALFTLGLTAIGTLFGVGLGILGAAVRAWRIKPFDGLFGIYVELIRNTPFIIQLFFIFFGLPALGVRLNEWEAATLAMVINLSAYSTEIIRAGIQAIRMLPLRGPAPGPGQGLAGAVESDHHRHARFGGVLADFHRGTVVRRQLHPIA